MPKTNAPLLNVLDRQAFTDWLEDRADAGDIAGHTGGVGEGQDAVERFIADVVGWQGKTLRFEYIRDDIRRATRYRLPGWAVEFMALCDKEPLDSEEDGVTCFISAERALAILQEVP